MSSREDDAKANLAQAIRDAKADFLVERVQRGAQGYTVVFHKGRVEHTEVLDEAVLDDGPATPAIRNLVFKVKNAFGEM